MAPPPESLHTQHPVRAILITNRSEIVIRVMPAASEMRLRTVAIDAHKDRRAFHQSQGGLFSKSSCR
jgi:pyruvate carboxylase